MRPPKLTFDAIGFRKKTDQILAIFEDYLAQIPEEQTNKRRTPLFFVKNLKEIKNTMDRIESDLIPNLQNELQIRFQTHELLYFALAQTSLYNLFSQIEEYFNNHNINSRLTSKDFRLLEGSGETSKLLALLGDAVLDLVVVETYWETSIDRVGEISRNRSEIVKNENLARICDKWKLFDYRLKLVGHTDKTNIKDLNHLKGTLVEALLGIIYMENDKDEVTRILPHFI